ncbi:MAG: polysaccharide biosynthesis protein [Nitrospirae bacterium]|nr:polysaccharide biosynthesis protein [Nitrospirota bacterium]
MRQYLKQLLYPTNFRRTLFFLLTDILIISLSIYLSFLLRFEFSLAEQYSAVIFSAIPFFISVKLLFFYIFRVYRLTWMYVGIRDLFNIVKAVVASELVLMVLVPLPFSFLPSQLHSFFYFDGFPRSIFFIDSVLSILLLSGLRISKRVFIEVFDKKGQTRKGKRTIIVGAGNTGEMILRDMLRPGYSGFQPIGFLDDNKGKIGTYIHGVKVLGATDKIKGAVRKYKAEAVIIAIPSLNHKALRRIYNSAKDSNIGTIKIVPGIYDFHNPDINLKTLEDISVEDLIGRQTVEIDYAEIGSLLEDKVILITGAGGSIGSEIVMQVCSFSPGKVILFDIDETALHNMSVKLSRKKSISLRNIHFVTGDIRDEARVKEVFTEFSPQIVFHAAAYKHVPLMEDNPKEAVKVNMFGTYILSKAAVHHRAEKFIMISTDKAVRPISIMGATKRMAEYICRALSEHRVQNTERRQQSTEHRAQTDFISVRFGNVLGSRGSVIPLFFEQLKYGGPLTVTHKDMKRYFMTIPEAVSLVLQASVIGRGGDVLVLDMGEPVKIVDLAEEFIKIHGLEPYKDIDIEFVGLRQGEKLFEEVLTAEEGVSASKHQKVFTARNSYKYSKEDIENILEEFKVAINEPSIIGDRWVRDLLRKYVRHYEGSA